MPGRVDGEGKAVASKVPAAAQRADRPAVDRRGAGAVAVEEPVDVDVAGRDGLAGLPGDRHEVVDGRADGDRGDDGVGRVVDVGRGRGGELLDERLRADAPTFGGFGLQFELPGPGRVVAQVVPGQRRVVAEQVAGQREVTGLDRVVAERQDVDPAAERQRAASSPRCRGWRRCRCPMPRRRSRRSGSPSRRRSVTWAELRMLPEVTSPLGRVDDVDQAVDGQRVLRPRRGCCGRVRAGIRVADLGRARTALGEADAVLDVGRQGDRPSRRSAPPAGPPPWPPRTV